MSKVAVVTMDECNVVDSFAAAGLAGATVALYARAAMTSPSLSMPSTSDRRQRTRTSAVGISTVGDAHDGDGDDLLVDRVHNPILAPASGPEAVKLTQQRLPDALRIVRQRTGDELPGGRGNVFRQVVLERASRGRRDSDPVGHER